MKAYQTSGDKRAVVTRNGTELFSSDQLCNARFMAIYKADRNLVNNGALPTFDQLGASGEDYTIGIESNNGSMASGSTSTLDYDASTSPDNVSKEITVERGKAYILHVLNPQACSDSRINDAASTDHKVYFINSSLKEVSSSSIKSTHHSIKKGDKLVIYSSLVSSVATQKVTINGDVIYDSQNGTMNGLIIAPGPSAVFDSSPAYQSTSPKEYSFTNNEYQFINYNTTQTIKMTVPVNRNLYFSMSGD